jgi:hypothetical protein
MDEETIIWSIYTSKINVSTIPIATVKKRVNEKHNLTIDTDIDSH